MYLLKILTALALLMLSGCDVPLNDAEMRSSDEGKLLLTIFHELEAKEFASARSRIDTRTKAEPGFDKMMEYLSEIISAEEPKSNKFTGWWLNASSETGRTSGISAEFEFQDKWMLVNATFAGSPPSLLCTSFTVQSAQKLADGSSPFAAASTPIRYVSLAFAVVTTLVCITAFVMCLLTKGLKRKWLWAIASLAGVCGFSLNVSTGNFLINFIDFGWFDGSWYWPDASQGAILHVAIPVGALLFFHKRHQHLTDSTAIGSPAP